MSARSAFAAGAGLVHVIAPPATIAAIRAGDPDIQTIEHPLEGSLAEGDLPVLDRADAVVIGPGLGREPERREFALAVMRLARRLVVDADAITIFQDDRDALAAALGSRPAVLTPHPGEFRTLFPDLASHLESDPWDAAARASEMIGAAVLLKGVPTVIARGGRCSYTAGAGNPGLATGGSGDVLSGIIGAALARDLEPDQAAALGAQVLGRAADAAARRTTARALRPMDVIEAFPDSWRAWSLPAPVARPPVLLELPAPAAV
jgi:NAD(P)H-hydrate epimerase